MNRSKDFVQSALPGQLANHCRLGESPQFRAPTSGLRAQGGQSADSLLLHGEKHAQVERLHHGKLGRAGEGMTLAQSAKSKTLTRAAHKKLRVAHSPELVVQKLSSYESVRVQFRENKPVARELRKSGIPSRGGVAEHAARKLVQHARTRSASGVSDSARHPRIYGA